MSKRRLVTQPWSILTAASVILLIAVGSFIATSLWWNGQSLVQAQDDQGAISNLQASSPNPSQLALTWNAPSETPTDYRVRWAPSNQDYLSFSEANTSERGSAYPTDTSYTVNNLADGTSYKVQARARYNGGEHADNPWSGPWSNQATITISSPPPPPPTSEPTPETTPEPTPEPTPPTDEVNGLALSSDTAGELLIEWNTPSDEPNDYRVTWAPANENYLSYSKENTSRRGNSYPDGSTTSLTLTSLPGGVTYKAMMRARYHDEQTNEHSSGPWTDEVTQRVKNNPPAAPTGLTTSEVSDSSVTLSWTAPSNSGITGYRVMRGLNPAKQDVLVNNTGSTSTEYVDSDVEASTEYHYSVRAINDAGVGPPSSTMAMTTGDDQTIAVRQDNVGTVTFTPTESDLGIPITASVTDADTPVTEETWQWSKSDTATGTFTDITGAASATYRPAEADLEKFLKARVTYIDSLATGNTSSAVASAAVQVVDRILVANISTGSTLVTANRPGLSQGFTTGGHPNGYKMSSMTITAKTNPEDMVVKVFSSRPTSEGHAVPSTERYTLTYRSSSGRHRTYDVPTGVRLDPNTDYHITLQHLTNGEAICQTLTTDSEDDTSAQDWDIDFRVVPLTANHLITGNFYPGASCKMRLRGEAAKDGPHITDLSYSTEPTQTRTYDTGDIIKVAATFSEAVTVSTTNPPTLPLKIGSNTRTATYLAADSTTTKLVFSYAVVAGDQDNDGITIDQNTLTGGITRESSTVAADLDHTAENNNPDRLVNAAPTVTKVELTSSPVAPNWYTTGETIEITVTFSIPITVAGDPVFRFALSIPGMTSNEDRSATYTASASEPNTMVFRYTVLATDEDPNGIWLGELDRTFLLDADDSIKDGIRTTDNKDAVLTHRKLATQGGHRVSPLPRLGLRVTSDPRSGSGSDTYGLGEMIEFTATFNQDITVTGDPQHAFSLLDDGGDTATERRVADYQASLSGTRTAVFTYTVVAADSDDNGIFLWGHSTGGTTFVLDADDTIKNSANADAVLDYARHRTQSGHKVDGSLTPPITVPALPDEDRNEVILISNYTGTYNPGTESRRLTSTQSGTQFTTGVNRHGYLLTKVTHGMGLAAAGSETAKLAVTKDAAGLPSASFYEFPHQTITDINPQEVTNVGEVLLEPNTKYWILVRRSSAPTNHVETYYKRSDDVDTGQTDWTLATSSNHFNPGWQSLNSAYALRLEGIVQTSSILATSYTGPIVHQQDRDDRSILHDKIATHFTTGNNQYGYHLTKLTYSISFDSSGAPYSIGAAINEDNNGVSGNQVYAFPDKIYGNVNTQPQTITHTGDSILKPNKKYWISISNKSSHQHGASLGNTNVNAALEANNKLTTGWRLSTSFYELRSGFWAATTDQPLQIRMEGAVIEPSTDEPDNRDFPMDASTPGLLRIGTTSTGTLDAVPTTTRAETCSRSTD